jgi:hypothetical protein
VTFKNAKDLAGNRQDHPADRLLVETDSPFLAPVPHRGQTCEPAFVADTAAFLADLRDEPIDSWPKRPPPTSSDCSTKPRREGPILGCGTSSGVPRIGNDWGDCDPATPGTAEHGPRSCSKAPASGCWSIAGRTSAAIAVADR